MLGWTLLHVIDTASPLCGQTEQSLAAARSVLLLTVSGTDEITGQTLMARKHYPASALRWNYSFVDILTLTPDGSDRFDYSRFHEIEPVESSPQTGS